MLKNKDDAFSAIYKGLPTWMSGRKRPEKSNSGKLFQSIADEQTQLNKELQKVINSFFLMNYAGKTETVLSHVYVANVGDIDTTATIDSIDNLTITKNVYDFLDNPDYALLQSGTLIIATSKITNQESVYYTYNGSQFRSNIKKRAIWNIFDEFARFTCLTRYENESNYELMQRCLAVFKNPTNSTTDGLKNAIINSIINFISIDKSSIKIEIPDETNMYIIQNDVPVYETLSRKNMDTMRTKIWDATNWGNTFAEIKYIPNIWDKEIEITQNGTGNGSNLKVIMASDNMEETTNVSVMAYKTSRILVDSYVRRYNLQQNIPIKMKKYKDELSPQSLEYRISATPVVQIDPDNIYIKSQKKTEGLSTHALSDIIIDPGNLTILGGGVLEKNAKYVVKVYPEDYTDFKIFKANLYDSQGNTINLLAEQGDYVLKNGILVNKNVYAYIDSIFNGKEIQNLIDVENGGFTLDDKNNEASLSFDVTGMGGQSIKISKYCSMTDYSGDMNFITAKGFKMTDTSAWSSDSTNSTDTLTIDMDCSEFTFTLALDPDPKKQGSIMVNCLVDGEPYSSMCGLFSKDKVFYASFDSLKDVKVTIKKMGAYPVTIKNINAARYEMDLTLDNGTVIYTKNGMSFSSFEDEKNTAHLTIRNYGNYTPVISYIYIGSTFSEPYVISGITTDDLGGTLDIQTDRKMSLYKVIDGVEQIQEVNYSTKKRYQNKTHSPITVPIDTSSFIKINKSDRTITKQLYNGSTTSCITVGVGEIVSDIEIDGITLVTKARDTIRTILSLPDSDIVYASSNAENFIIKSANSTYLKRIEKSDLNKDSDVFTYEGIPSNARSIFIINSATDAKTRATSFDRDFENTYIIPADTQEYIAYNKCSLVQTPTYTTMSDTFSPVIDTLSNFLFYKVDNMATNLQGELQINFVNGNELAAWSLGKNVNIRIDYDKLGNEDNCLYEIKVLNEIFDIANTIKLKNIYYDNELDYELSRWILTPPDEMQVEYETQDTVEKFIVKEDSINKLYYSNVVDIDYVRINGKEISINDYFLMDVQGIISWNTNKYTGEIAEVGYTYKQPIALSYKDISSLYNIIGYSTDAYVAMSEDPILLKKLSDGSKQSIKINDEIPDKITASCSNPNFTCTIDGNELTVNKQNNENKALIHNGYYYENGKEYFAFETAHTETVDRKEDIQYNNVVKNSNSAICNQSNDNYIKNSKFNTSDTYGTICKVMPTDYDEAFENFSIAGTLTACDSFQLWNTFNMNISLTTGYNDNGLKFTPSDSNGYGILDITKFVVEGNIITFYASEDLNIYYGKEVLTDDEDSMLQSTFCEIISTIKKNADNSNFRQIICKDIEENKRHYLIVQGKGIIDDIISDKYDENSNIIIENIHDKNISLLGFDIKEKAQSSMICHLDFDLDGNNYDGLEIDESGALDTGSNIDWGLTRCIYYADDMSEISCSGGAYVKKGAVLTDSDSGQMRTPKIRLSNIASVNTAYVKVNDIIKDSFKNFKITLRGSDNGSTNWINIKTVQKGNLLEIPGESLKSYVQIVVDMDTQKVINSIELYVKYAEVSTHNLRITPYENGTMTTKIYDTGTLGKWRYAGINGEVNNPDSIHAYVRGYRTNDNDGVWTRWYSCETFGDTLDNHIFNDYRLFQFRIAITDPDTKLKVNSFILEAI